MSTDPQSFPDSFYSLTGYRPMRWQGRLFRQLINGKFPSALDLPTGLGKTSVMAVWLIALAEQVAVGAVRLLRRLVYVVDRRSVVDQATDEALIRGAPASASLKHGLVAPAPVMLGQSSEACALRPH